MKTIKDKHEQLYVAVQDLLIELDITPKKLRDIAANKTHNSINPKTAQGLIDADLIVEQINWRMPGNVFGPHQKDDSSVVIKDKDLSRQLKSFKDKIYVSKQCQKIIDMIDMIAKKDKNNSCLPCLSEDNVQTVFNKIKDKIRPRVLWEYLAESHPEFLENEARTYLCITYVIE